MQKEFIITTGGNANIATAVADIAQQSFAAATLSAGGIVGDNITILEVKIVGADPNQSAETAKALAYLQRRETNLTQLAADLYARYSWKVTTTTAEGGIYTLPIVLPPTVRAGSNQNLPSGTTTATLTGNAIDPNGGTITYRWTKTSGPASGAITTPTAASTGLTALVAGTYVFTLTATTANGSASSSVTVIVAA